MYEDQEDVLGLIVTHAQALIWAMDIAKNHELADPEVAITVMEEMQKDSKTIWEEQLWRKVTDGFKEDLPSASIYKFSLDTRGPDT